MDRILKIEDNEAKLVREELELIPEFKALLSLNYNKDKGDQDGRKRFRATKEFTYIWFMYSNHSPYREYEEKERKLEALQTAGLPHNYPISTDLQAAIEKYKKLTDTRVLRLIRSAEKAVDKLRDYFETVDFTERNSSGTLVNKPSEIIKAIGDLDDVSSGLEKLATRQRAEKNQFVDARGTQEAGWLMEQDKLNGTRSRDSAAEDN